MTADAVAKKYLPIAFGTLLRELPPDVIIHETEDEEFTAEQMADLLEANEYEAIDWLQHTLAIYVPWLEGHAEDRQIQPVDAELLDMARTSDLRALWILARLELTDGAVVFVHPEFGDVTKEQLVASLEAHDEIAVAYGAAVMSLFRELMNEYEEEEEEEEESGD
jgi:hypothetical protein